MTERFLEDEWPTHLVNPEILFTDEGMAQAERLHNAQVRQSVLDADMIRRGAKLCVDCRAWVMNPDIDLKSGYHTDCPSRYTPPVGY